eukprot:GHVH01014282.1.p1 GENE.GHVH01014282.1~~GHVH01014282.1.p1  ORF type:complete len:507 (+),score=66.81 GHVH01014282.1:175-1521(+)
MSDAVVNIKDASNVNLLHLACASGNLSVVKFLLELNPRLALGRSNNGDTPHKMAANLNDSVLRVKILSDLLEADHSGIRGGAIHSAVYEGHLDVIELVVHHFQSHNLPVDDLFEEDVDALGMPMQCALSASSHKGDSVVKALLVHVRLPTLLINSPSSGIPSSFILAAALDDPKIFDLFLDLEGLQSEDLIRCLDPAGYSLLHVLSEVTSTKGTICKIKKLFPDAYHFMLHSRNGGDTPHSMCRSPKIIEMLLKDFDPRIVKDNKKICTDKTSSVTNTKDVDVDVDTEKLIRDKLRSEYDDEVDDCYCDELMDRLFVMKAEGSQRVTQKDWKAALEIYNRIIDTCPRVKRTQEFRSIIHSNLSLCYDKLGDWNSALETSRKAVGLNPMWSKGYLRLSIALASSGDYAEASQQVYKAMLLVGDETTNRAVLERYLEMYVEKAKAMAVQS